jgi:hypothetical protein
MSAIGQAPTPRTPLEPEHLAVIQTPVLREEVFERRRRRALCADAARIQESLAGSYLVCHFAKAISWKLPSDMPPRSGVALDPEPRPEAEGETALAAEPNYLKNRPGFPIINF